MCIHIITLQWLNNASIKDYCKRVLLVHAVRPSLSVGLRKSVAFQEKVRQELRFSILWNVDFVKIPLGFSEF